MMQIKKKVIFVVGVSFLIVIGIFKWYGSSSLEQELLPVFGPQHFRGFNRYVDHKVNQHRIAPFKLKNQFNKSISQAVFNDHITVVSFFYSSCQLICPTIIKRLKLIQKQYIDNSKVQLISFSITPDIDTPDVLLRYAKQENIDGAKWNLLTGHLPDIVQLARHSFFSEAVMEKGFNNNIHTEMIFLVDSSSQIRGLYNSSVRRDLELLEQDIRTLLKSRVY